jgi:hypothetical protein
MSSPEGTSLTLQREEIISKIRKWVKEEGYSFETEKSRENSYYFARYDVGKGLMCHIDIPRDQRDRIHIMFVVGFKEIDVKAFDRLSEDKQNIFYHNMEVALAQANVRFLFRKPTHQIMLWKTLFFDGLTKHSFHDSVSSGVSVVNLALAKYVEFTKEIFSGQL